MSYPLELARPGIILRDFSMSDASDAAEIVGDDAVTRSLSFDSRTPEQAQQMIADAIERAQTSPRSEYYLAITLPSDKRMIGFARLGLSGVNAAKLGYAVRSAEWGKGYATRAAQVLIDFGFSTLKLHRISAAAGPDNAPSIAILEKLGFSFEGRIRDHVFTNGAWRDSLLYSLLEPEWLTAEYSELAVRYGT